MKIGDKEWFEELQKEGRFPGMYCYSLGFDKDDNQCVTVKTVQTTSTNPKNVKYGSLSHTLSQMLAYKDLLILGVHYVETPEEYYTILSGYMEKWMKWMNDNKSVKDIS